MKLQLLHFEEIGVRIVVSFSLILLFSSFPDAGSSQTVGKVRKINYKNKELEKKNYSTDKAVIKRGSVDVVAKKKIKLKVDDIFITKKDVTARLDFDDNRSVKLNQSTEIKVLAGDLLFLTKGEIVFWAETKDTTIATPGKHQITTNHGSAGLQGTELLIRTNSNSTELVVFEGTVDFKAKNDSRSIEVRAYSAAKTVSLGPPVTNNDSSYVAQVRLAALLWTKPLNVGWFKWWYPLIPVAATTTTYILYPRPDGKNSVTGTVRVTIPPEND